MCDNLLQTLGYVLTLLHRVRWIGYHYFITMYSLLQINRIWVCQKSRYREINWFDSKLVLLSCFLGKMLKQWGCYTLYMSIHFRYQRHLCSRDSAGTKCCGVPKKHFRTLSELQKRNLRGPVKILRVPTLNFEMNKFGSSCNKKTPNICWGPWYFEKDPI